MRIILITESDYNYINDSFEKNPNLILQNKGYETLNKKNLSESDLITFERIESILKHSIWGFSSFTNLRLNKEGKKELRFQYNYNYDNEGITFVGVGYILLDELFKGFKK